MDEEGFQTFPLPMEHLSIELRKLLL